jgi:small subunit ribosomal protein S16
VLKIRLRRTGARKRPNYRLVVADSTAPRDGQYLEIIGFYDPLMDPATVRIDAEKARTWITKGAKPTERVARLLAREGIVEQPAAADA